MRFPQSYRIGWNLKRSRLSNQLPKGLPNAKHFPSESAKITEFSHWPRLMSWTTETVERQLALVSRNLGKMGKSGEFQSPLGLRIINVISVCACDRRVVSAYSVALMASRSS